MKYKFDFVQLLKLNQVMTTRLTILFFTSLFVMSALTQNIVDFTYSEYDQQQQKAVQRHQAISIRPSKDIIQGYSFPEACYLSQKLQEVRLEDSQEIGHTDFDSIIESLKTEFIQMLKVSQKIKKKRSNIQELSQMSGRTENITIVRPNDLEALKKQEQKLKNLNDQINKKSMELQILVQDSMRDSGGNEFAISAVNFQIQSLKLKLGYLNNLQKSNDATSSKAKDDYDKFFNELKKKFEEENNLVHDLNLILQNYNLIESLRAKVLSLKGKIDISDLMIQEKQACKKEKDQIQKFQKNDLQIKTHMSNLREKKKDKSNINNKFCQGVAKKLLDRVKKVLQSYDYTFYCAQGLDEIKRQRQEDKSQLQTIEERIRNLQKNGGFEQYKQKFEKNREYIKIKQVELSKFSIPQYYHDVGELKRLIQKASNDLLDAEKRKIELGNPSGKKDIDYRKIQDLVYTIKRLKGTYCHDYQIYENRAQELWKIVQKYEAEVEYSSKIRGIYEEQINELRQLQTTFDNLRSNILKRIE